MRVRPAARDKLAVPAQRCVRFDCEVRPSRSRHRATERSEQRSIRTRQPRPSRLTPKNRKLVTQEQDLELLRATRSCQQPHQREQIPQHEKTNVQSKQAPPETDGKSPEPNEPDAHQEPRTSLRTLRAYAIRKLLVVTHGNDRKGSEDRTPSIWNSLDNRLPTENKSTRRRERIIGPSVALARLSSVDVCAAFGFGGEFVQ
jgi:hypothetical protein